MMPHNYLAKLRASRASGRTLGVTTVTTATVPLANESTRVRSISAVARDIRREWKNVYFGAVPYLSAMQSLDGPGDMYGCDDARGIVLYFLGNAHAFRGERARALKAELKAICNIK